MTLHLITELEADSLCEVTGGYGCALLTEAGVTVVEGGHVLTNTLLDNGQVASYCERFRHFSPDLAQMERSAGVARKYGALAFENETYAEVMAETLVKSGYGCRVNVLDEPLAGFVAVVIVE